MKEAAFLICVAVAGHALTVSSPAFAQNWSSVEQMAERANLDAQALGNGLLVALKKNMRCENGNDASAVLQFGSFDQHMALAEAETAALENVVGIRREREANARLRLNIADAARASNCLIVANDSYRMVMKFYTEARFEGLRELAKLGIEDIRDKNNRSEAGTEEIRKRNRQPQSAGSSFTGRWLEGK
jgi:hypothetical protein